MWDFTKPQIDNDKRIKKETYWISIWKTNKQTNKSARSSSVFVVTSRWIFSYQRRVYGIHQQYFLYHFSLKVLSRSIQRKQNPFGAPMHVLSDLYWYRCIIVSKVISLIESHSEFEQLSWISYHQGSLSSLQGYFTCS